MTIELVYSAIVARIKAQYTEVSGRVFDYTSRVESAISRNNPKTSIGVSYLGASIEISKGQQMVVHSYDVYAFKTYWNLDPGVALDRLDIKGLTTHIAAVYNILKGYDFNTELPGVLVRGAVDIAEIGPMTSFAGIGAPGYSANIGFTVSYQEHQCGN